PTVLVAGGSTLTALRADASTRWAITLPAAIQGDPALGDFDGDGLDEVVVVAGATISVLDSNGVANAVRSPHGVPSAPVGAPVVGPLRAGHAACIGVRLGTGFYAWD